MHPRSHSLFNLGKGRFSTNVNWSLGATPPRGVSARPGAAAELGLLLAAFEWCLWTDSRQVLPKAARLAGSGVLVLVVAFLLIRQRPTARELGLAPGRRRGTRNWRDWFDGGWSLALGTLGGMIALLVAGWWLGTIGQTPTWSAWVRKNWHLEGAQQLLLQVLLVPRLEQVLGRRGAPVTLMAALFFGLLHLPNLPLSALSFVGAVGWCEWFRRHPNLPAVWLSHLALAATALYTINGPALGMLRVGIGYVYRNS